MTGQESFPVSVPDYSNWTVHDAIGFMKDLFRQAYSGSSGSSGSDPAWRTNCLEAGIKGARQWLVANGHGQGSIVRRNIPDDFTELDSLFREILDRLEFLCDSAPGFGTRVTVEAQVPLEVTLDQMSWLIGGTPTPGTMNNRSKEGRPVPIRAAVGTPHVWLYSELSAWVRKLWGRLDVPDEDEARKELKERPIVN